MINNKQEYINFLTDVMIIFKTLTLLTIFDSPLNALNSR